MAQIVALTTGTIVETLGAHSEALRALGVIRIGLFGSRARGDAAPDSDIDLLVTLVDHRYETYCKVLFYLEDLFACPVDLVPEADVRPELRPHILAEVIYAPEI